MPAKPPRVVGAPRRLSAEKQQEQVSRGQIIEAFEGWNCNSLGEDLGEDFLVSIYDDGRSTGLTFQLQLKSTKDLQSFVPKRSPGEIHYPLEVADLKHWEDACPPVVVAVWDVRSRSGCWHDVPSIIATLSKANEKWRTKGSVAVHIPLKNGLDAIGRHALRHRIARLVLPAISNGKTLEIRPVFSFPKTALGNAAFVALRAAIEDGESTTIGKNHIEQFEMSPWWERVFGTSLPDEVTIASGPSDVRLKIVLEAIGESSVERIPLDLRRIKAGTKRATFANEDPDDAVRLTIKFEDEATRVHLKAGVSHPHPNVSTNMLLTKVLLILRGGGSLRVVLEDGVPVGVLSLDVSEMPSTRRLRAWERLLRTLAFVEAHTARYGRFKLGPRVTEADVNHANRLRMICATGEEVTTMTMETILTAPPTLAGADPSNQSVDITIDPFGDIDLFGVTVPLGKVRVEFLDGAEIIGEFAAAERDGRRKLTFKDARVRLRYLEWNPPAIGPATTAANRAARPARRPPAKAGPR